MVDGSMLNFMKTTDVYALFGNLMDNAIESVIKEEDDEKRIISISVKEKIREHIFILRITAMSKSHLMMDCQLQLKKTKTIMDSEQRAYATSWIITMEPCL